MADPVLDEDFIAHLLAIPVTHETADAVQAGAIQTLIDLYDRKVTRDEFMGSVGVCIALYAQCAKYWMLNSIKQAYESGELNSQHFASAELELEKIIKAQAQKVSEVLSLLMQCPTSGDKVH